MANRGEVYKCELCGNIVEVLHGGAATRLQMPSRCFSPVNWFAADRQ